MTKMSKTFGVVCCIMVLSVFATVVRTEGVWANDVRHGPCVTGNGTPGDRQDYWFLAFARVQKDLPNMPRKAKFKDDWKALTAAYPFIQNDLKQVLADIKSHVNYEKGPWKNINESLPYTRLCLPSELGIKSGVLKPTDYNIHFNPTGTATDTTATLFYKALIRNKKVWLPAGIGKARH